MNDTSLPGAVNWLGTSYKIHLAREHGESLGMFESVAPARSGPPRHVHHREDEIFYILSGDVLFWLEGESAIKGPGEVVFVARGREHTFQVVSDRPARMLTLLTPGGFEGFFGEMARNGYRIPEDMKEVTAVGERYGVRFTGPPLGAG